MSAGQTAAHSSRPACDQYTAITSNGAKIHDRYGLSLDSPTCTATPSAATMRNVTMENTPVVAHAAAPPRQTASNVAVKMGGSSVKPFENR